MMKMRTAILAPLLILASSCASAVGNLTRVDNAIVTERSVVPPYSGYLKTWIEIGLRKDEEDMVVLLPHFEDGRTIPDLGDSCSFEFHQESIEGIVGDKNIRIESAKVVDRLDCDR